jgi:hypothetical protein
MASQINETGINAQDAMLWHMAGARLLSERHICGTHPPYFDALPYTVLKNFF